MLVGLAVLLAAFIASRWLELYTIDWIVQSFWSQIVIALIILFQPEIKEGACTDGPESFLRTLSPIEETRFIEEIIRSAVSLANKKIGAIIVLERETELKDLIEMGTPSGCKDFKRDTDEYLLALFTDSRWRCYNQRGADCSSRMFPAPYHERCSKQGHRHKAQGSYRHNRGDRCSGNSYL